MSQVLPAAPQHFFELRLGENDEKLGQLHAFGTYWTWAQSYESPAPPLRVLEWTKDGIADLTTEHYSMHVSHAGVPHRVEGLFGYWLISDADHVWIQAPRHDRYYYALIAGGKTGVNRSHSLTWYCQECGTQLGEPRRIEHDGSPAAFLRLQQAAVNAFNSDAAARLCPRCTAVHPPAYPWRTEAQGSTPSDSIQPMDVQAALAPAVLGAEPQADDTVAHLRDLEEGIPRLVSWSGTQIVLVRQGTDVFALGNACPHRGGPLVLGEVRNGAITCPWHRFRFNLATGESLTNAALCVTTYDVEIREEKIVIVAEAKRNTEAQA